MTLWYKYPYTSMHDMNLDWIIETIKDLKEKVDQMDMETLISRLDQVDEALGALETDNVQIKADLRTAQVLLQGLRTDLTADEARIDTIESTLENIDVILEPLSERVSELSADVGAMQSQVTSNTGRIEALEDATLNAPTEGNENLIIAQMQNLDNVDYEIVKVTDNGSEYNNIQVVNGLIRMLPNAAYNEMALVIKNVLPVLVGTFTSSQILSFGLKYKLSSSNGTDYCVNVPFTSLTGSNPYIANTDYTSTRASLRVLQLKVGEDGKSYDLWIYNRYHGDYGILVGANIDILAIAAVFRGFDSSFTTASIKAYFTTVYNNFASQIASLINKKGTTITTNAVNAANAYTDRAIEISEGDLSTMITQTVLDSETIINDEMNDYVDQSTIAQTSGEVSFNAIQDLNSDVTVDYSKCKFGISKFTGNLFSYDNWNEEIRLYINIEVTITGSGAVNTPSSIPILNVSNTKGATIPSIVPLTAIAALPSKAPFTEAYLHTNGNIILRCWFDDTNWDFTTNPVTVRISGFIPLPYQVQR